MRDVRWKDVFKLGVFAAASEFCEWVQVGIDAYIPHRKYQVNPHSSPWFSAACAAAIVHRNHFFHFLKNCDSLHTTTTRHGLIRQRSTKRSQYIGNLFRKNLQLKKDKSSDSKVKFRQASNRCKRVPEAAKPAYADKTKESITSQKLGSLDFW